MKRLIFFLTLSLFFLTVGVYAEPVEINGYVRNYTGAMVTSDDYAVLQNTLDLRFSKKGDKGGFLANIYGKNNVADDENIFDIRELYVDFFFESMDIRVGKQQILWGKADGVFITDIVSPKDLSEFILPDFKEVRMGVDALKLDFYQGDNTFEIVVIPRFIGTVMPESSSVWYPKSSLMSTLPVTPDIQEVEDIDISLTNTEIFGKYSIISSLVDLEVMGGYTWDDDPTLHIVKNLPTDIKIFRRHHRLGVTGGSFSFTVDPFVIRGEGAYYFGKYFNTTDPTAVDGLIERDYMNYLMGIDFSIGETKISTQFTQKIILNYEDAIFNDQFSNMATFLVKRDFINETLHAELFLYYDINDQDALIRAKLSYDLMDGFNILIGVNYFLGDEGLFGQYSDNSMIYSKIKYSF